MSEKYDFGEICRGCKNLKNNVCSKGHKTFMTPGYAGKNVVVTACNGCYEAKLGIFQ